MSQAADLSGREGSANHREHRKDPSHQQPVQGPCKGFAQKIHCNKAGGSSEHPAFIRGASSIPVLWSMRQLCFMLKHKKEQPKDRELQEHEETHTSKGKLALFSLSRVKGQVCVCFIPLRSASPGSAEQGTPAGCSCIILLINV